MVLLTFLCFEHDLICSAFMHRRTAQQAQQLVKGTEGQRVTVQSRKIN